VPVVDSESGIAAEGVLVGIVESVGEADVVVDGAGELVTDGEVGGLVTLGEETADGLTPTTVDASEP
jgi:hypothetical protein